MRGFVVITDSEAMPAFEAAFQGNNDRGFTIVPKVVGRGRSGLKMGSRVHPGGSSLLLTVVPDAEAEATARFLRETRDRAGAREQTKIFSMLVEPAD